MSAHTHGGPTSRNIPLPIQREIRQRCGFGCVICGIPLYEYEHLLGWANVQRHVADEMTLLCDKHHKEKTYGLLPLDDVIEADKNPYNLTDSPSKPYDLHYSGGNCEILIGGNRFVTTDNGYGTQVLPLVVDGVPMVGFILTDEHLLLNVNVFDEQNELVLSIVNNQLFYSATPWDINLVGKKLQIREGHRRFLLSITFETPNRVVIDRGRFLYNGVEVMIEPSFVLVTNNQVSISGCTAENVEAGLVIGTGNEPLGCIARIRGVPRGYEEDRRKAALKWAQS